MYISEMAWGPVHKRRPVIAIDFDDVLFDFAQRYKDLMRDMGFKPDKDYFRCFGELRNVPEAVKQYVNSRKNEFYIEEYLKPGAVEFVNYLRLFAEVLIVSTTFRNYSDDKLNLIDSAFGEEMRKNTIITHRKDRVLADILLDDGTHNCKAFEDANIGIAVLFDVGRYDKGQEDFPYVVRNFSDAAEIIRDITLTDCSYEFEVRGFGLSILEFRDIVSSAIYSANSDWLIKVTPCIQPGIDSDEWLKQRGLIVEDMQKLPVSTLLSLDFALELEYKSSDDGDVARTIISLSDVLNGIASVVDGALPGRYIICYDEKSKYISWDLVDSEIADSILHLAAFGVINNS